MTRGTYISTIAYDGRYLAATTSDPFNEEENEKLILYSWKEMKVVKVLDWPKYTSTLKLVGSELAVGGHFDGSITSLNLQDGVTNTFRAHTADILAIDLNMVSPLIQF